MTNLCGFKRLTAATVAIAASVLLLRPAAASGTATSGITTSGIPTAAAPRQSDLSVLRVVQAGSAGGSIGNQNKSVSGSQPEAARAKSTKHEASAKHERRSTARQASAGGGGVSRFDGPWKVVTAAQACPYSADATISGGVVTSAGFAGSVTSGGTLTGVFNLAGYTATILGRLSGNSGKGTFKRNDGCEGEWTMVKQ